MSALSPTPVIYRLNTARLPLLHAPATHFLPPPPSSSAAPGYGLRPAASSRPRTRRVEPRRQRLLPPLLPQRARPRRYASTGIQRGLRAAPGPPWPGRWKRSCPRICCAWRWGGGGGVRAGLREREVKGGRAGPGCGAAGSGWGGPAARYAGL